MHRASTTFMMVQFLLTIINMRESISAHQQLLVVLGMEWFVTWLVFEFVLDGVHKFVLQVEICDVVRDDTLGGWYEAIVTHDSASASRVIGHVWIHHLKLLLANNLLFSGPCGILMSTFLFGHLFSVVFFNLFFLLDHLWYQQLYMTDLNLAYFLNQVNIQTQELRLPTG